MIRVILFSAFFHVFVFFCSNVNSQVVVNTTIEYKKYIKIEYINTNDFPIEIEDISLRNFNEECKITKTINKNYYRLSNDTLILDFERDKLLPKCLYGNIAGHKDIVGEFRFRKINIEPNGKAFVVFQIPLNLLRQVRYLKQSYGTVSELTIR